MSPAGDRPEVVVLDLDGTLVDSVPLHVIAWQAAFRDVGLTVPSHRLQRAIGLGGDHLVPHVCGEEADRSIGDEVRARHPAHLTPLLDRIHPTEGAAELLAELRRHRVRPVLASSSDADLTARLLARLEGAEDQLDLVVTGSDAEETKPSGEPIARALERAGTTSALVVGDAVWDVQSAAAAEVGCVGVLTGGICSSELLDAGALAVHDTPAALAAHLRDTGRLT